MKRILLALSFVCALVAGSQTAVAEGGNMPDGVLSWFEIPVTNMDRAIVFYDKILMLDLKKDVSHGAPMAFFPMKPKEASGALIEMSEFKPGSNGPVLYLNGGDNLQVVLDRVTPAGGKVILPKTLISADVGYFALFLDTEGNRIGLYSAH